LNIRTRAAFSPTTTAELESIISPPALKAECHHRQRKIGERHVDESGAKTDSKASVRSISQLGGDNGTSGIAVALYPSSSNIRFNTN